MPAIQPSEVAPGLVVHIDTNILRHLGNSETNAEVDAKLGDRAVQGPHYFLITDVDQANGIATAVPLFSKNTKGSELLKKSKKTGYASKWKFQYSYFSRWQHWRVPVDDLVAASASEESSPLDRRRYASSDIAEIAAINSWKDKNRCGFRKLK